MNQRAFRLDFFIAIGALLTSALTALTLVYQTHVIGAQYAATVWPYLSVTATYGLRGEKFEIGNDGLGPALIESAQLSVDGRPVSGWPSYLRALAKEPGIRRIFRGKAVTVSMGSITGSTTIRAGDSKSVLAISVPVNIPTAELVAHTVAIDLCYCSLNGTCWILHAQPGAESSEHPAQTSTCTRGANIDSGFTPPPR
jgi:hypothetical protein